MSKLVDENQAIAYGQIIMSACSAINVAGTKLKIGAKKITVWVGLQSVSWKLNKFKDMTLAEISQDIERII